MKTWISMAASLGMVLLLAPVSTLMAMTAYVLVQVLWPGENPADGVPPDEKRDKFADGERMAREVLGKNGC